MNTKPNNILSDVHYAEIGKIIVNWSAFELTLEFLAYCLTVNGSLEETADRTAFIIFNGMQTRTLVGILQSLVQLRHPADLPMIKKFGKRVLKAKSMRDTIGHTIFVRGKRANSIAPHMMKSVGGIKQAEGDLTPEDLAAHAAEIGRLSVTAVALLAHWGYFDPTAHGQEDTGD